MEGGAKSGGRDGRRFYRSQSFTHGQSQIAFRIYTVLNIPRFCVFFLALRMFYRYERGIRILVLVVRVNLIVIAAWKQ